MRPSRWQARRLLPFWEELRELADLPDPVDQPAAVNFSEDDEECGVLTECPVRQEEQPSVREYPSIADRVEACRVHFRGGHRGGGQCS